MQCGATRCPPTTGASPWALVSPRPRVTREIFLESKIILTSVDHRPRALRTGSRVPDTKTFCLALASNGSSELMSWLCTSTRRDPARARVSGKSLRRDVIDLIVQGVPDVCSPPSSRASVEGRRHVHVARRQARPSGSTSPTRARSGLPCVRFSGPAHERPGDNPS